MTRFDEVADELKRVQRKANNHFGNSSFYYTQTSSSIREDADAAVQEFQDRVANRIKKEGKDKDEEMIDAPATSSSTGWPVRIYNISRPNPTITLPDNYRFRTTETGYPVLTTVGPSSTDRANMTAEQKAMEQRIASFIHRWTKAYNFTGDDIDPVNHVEGMFQLRLECQVRGLVTYGSKDMLVARLVDRALRDATQGWSEVEDSVGRIRYDSAPQ